MGRQGSCSAAPAAMHRQAPAISAGVYLYRGSLYHTQAFHCCEVFYLKNVIIIGGGAAGMMCAALAAEKGINVTIVEKNEKLGKKLFITGKGRCNFTNACTEEEFLENVITNRRFLYSAIYGFDPQAVMQTFEKWGMPCKVERGRRAFPASDKSSDVIGALKRQLKKNHVRVLLKTEAERIFTDEFPDGFPEVEGQEDKRGHDAASAGHQIAGVESSKSGLAVSCAEDPEREAHKMRERPDKKHGVRHPDRRVSGVLVRNEDGREMKLMGDAVVIATGGLSYPSTGSTGDGLRFAREAGLSVTDTYPSLVPMNCREDYVKEMQGLSLKNVELHIKCGKKDVFSGFGEMMFTHFGITGPLVLSASAKIGAMVGKKALDSWIDLKPAVPEDTLDARLIRIFSENPNKEFKGILHALFPGKMVSVIPEVAGIKAEKRIHDITRAERQKLISAMKHFPLTITSLRDYNEAVVTKGGISVREINPGTMETKRIAGLFCIGEVLDLDAYTGGYNLQVAWCTAASCANALAGAD